MRTLFALLLLCGVLLPACQTGGAGAPARPPPSEPRPTPKAPVPSD
jgi:hypothetical protein